MNPIAAREATVYAGADARLDGALRGYVEGVGLPFLVNAPNADICASAQQAGNATVVVQAFIQGEECPGSAIPAAAVASSSLTLQLPGRTVVVEAWLEGR